MLLVVPNSNSSMIHIAAKVSFRLNNQSVGSTYFLLQQPMDGDLELLFDMLLVVPISISSNRHVWPKGMFLQINSNQTALPQKSFE
jgi:hypothetical protein